MTLKLFELVGTDEARVQPVLLAARQIVLLLDGVARPVDKCPASRPCWRRCM
jgi:hypothetical protein